jgi:Virulence factor
MAEYRVTRWRHIPSLVTAREPDGQIVKVPLPDRFQEAIDELAMRTGAVGSDAYLEGWVQEDWQRRSGDAASVAAAVAGELEKAHPPADLAALAAGAAE